LAVLPPSAAKASAICFSLHFPCAAMPAMLAAIRVLFAGYLISRTLFMGFASKFK
jgi:hypothetical protein